MNISVYTLTSELHDEQAVSAVTKEFLNSLKIKLDFKGADYADYGSHTLDLIYVRTGGTEGIFRKLLPTLLKQSVKPFYLLTSGKSNSLAASMEILSFLRQNGLSGEIIHGSPEYISGRISLLARTGKAKEMLRDCRLGIIGKPSDWLISSEADKDMLRQKLGIELVSVPMEELLAPCFLKRSSFENFKSNICHRVKELGDIDFLIETLESHDIRTYYERKWYPESLYLLAMLDYISRENDVPLVSEYDDIRRCRLEKPVYPASLRAVSAAARSDAALKEAEKTAIPEFMRFNIIESEVRNVI